VSGVVVAGGIVAAGCYSGGHLGSGGGGGQPGAEACKPRPDLPADPVCESGACWLNPLPSGSTWRAVHGSSPADVWIGGEVQDGLHFDGRAWQLNQGIGFIDYLWAFSPTDVWATLPGVTYSVIHGDGTTFDPSPATGVNDPPAQDLWGDAPNDLYAGRIDGLATILHWDGATWTPVAGVSGAALAGSGPSDVWASGFNGLWHFDGQAWTQVHTPGGDIRDIASAGPGRIWILLVDAGGTNILLHDGISWTTSVAIPDQPAPNLLRLASAGANQALAVGQKANGTPAGRAYAWRWDGNSWAEMPVDRPGAIEDAWLDGSGSGYLVGDGGLVLHVGPRGVDRSITRGPSASFTGVWGQSASDVWLVARDGDAYHYDGCGLSRDATEARTPLADVWGAGCGELWAVGAAGTLVHRNGAGWAPIPLQTTADLQAVWAASPDEVWVGGTAQTLLRITPWHISPVVLPGIDPTEAIDITDIHGSSASDVWVTTAGSRALVFHFDGSSWGAPLALQPAYFTATSADRIWAYSPTDVWTELSGSGFTTTFHDDGTGWTEVQPPVPAEAAVVYPYEIPGGTPASNSFAFDPQHILWVGDLGAFVRSQ
jgi:hypothetical protein